MRERGVDPAKEPLVSFHGGFVEALDEVLALDRKVYGEVARVSPRGQGVT